MKETVCEFSQKPVDINKEFKNAIAQKTMKNPLNWSNSRIRTSFLIIKDYRFLKRAPDSTV